ncbi:transposase [Atopobium sp. oral taxon 416]|uniref:transposase n=1 Tax=Atopobium sp. oral taxon 416 TaxID=712157 RepID=UPI00211191D6|nr:transposase [Atopobium sp. oral taxon 416]
MGVSEMPQAAQIVDSFHVVQLLNVRCAEKRESAKKHKTACADEIHMAQEEGGARFTQLHIGQKLVIPVTNK